MKNTQSNLKFGSFSINLLTYLLLFGFFVLPITAQTKDKSDQYFKPIPPERKVIQIFANQGPFGEMYLPKELVAASNEFKLVANQTRKQYFFPSIYFVLSAKPNLQAVPQGMRGDLVDYEYKNLSQNLEWLKIEISAVVKDCSGNEIKGENAIRILGLLPDETIARTEESSVAQGVAKGGELANAVVPFFPGASSIVETGTNIANVLFSNILYPPRLVTYRYSFMDNQRKFGWYWRADKANNTSLLGLRRGVILLQAERTQVKSIELSYSVYAKWNEDIDKNVDDEYVDPNNKIETITFDGDCKVGNDKNFFESQNYRFLKNLDGFPMLIPEDVVCDIFQVTKEKDCQLGEEKCLETACNDWISELLNANKEISFFTVNRPAFKTDKDNKIVRAEIPQTIRLLRRPDLENLLVDKKKKEVKEYQISVQQ